MWAPRSYETGAAPGADPFDRYGAVLLRLEEALSNVKCAPVTFQPQCRYYPWEVHGLPKFCFIQRLERMDVTFEAHSFGARQYLQANAAGSLCSRSCSCRRLGPSQFAFVVLKTPKSLRVYLHNDFVLATVSKFVAVQTDDSWKYKYCDGLKLFAKFQQLKSELSAAFHRGVSAQDCMALRLLVHGLLADPAIFKTYGPSSLYNGNVPDAHLAALEAPRATDRSFTLEDLFLPELEQDPGFGFSVISTSDLVTLRKVERRYDELFNSHNTIRKDDKSLVNPLVQQLHGNQATSFAAAQKIMRHLMESGAGNVCLAELFRNARLDLNADYSLYPYLRKDMHILYDRPVGPVLQRVGFRGGSFENPVQASFKNMKSKRKHLNLRATDTLPSYLSLKTALHMASGAGKKAIVELLLEYGAPVNTWDVLGATPLHDAAAEGHLDIVQLLCEKRADVGWINQRGETALHKACMAGHEDVVAWLLQNEADINARDHWGVTPLQAAAAAGHESIVLLLCRGGADVNSSDEYGDTALTVAARAGHKNIFNTLHDDYDASLDAIHELDIHETFDIRKDRLWSIRHKKKPNKQVLRIREMMRRFFVVEYTKMAEHVNLDEEFRYPIRAWEPGLRWLHDMSHRGVLPQRLHQVMILLCVGRAISMAIDDYADAGYVEWFNRDIPRWSVALPEMERQLFHNAVGKIWGISEERWWANLDREMLFKSAQEMASKLIQEGEDFLRLDESGPAGLEWIQRRWLEQQGGRQTPPVPSPGDRPQQIHQMDQREEAGLDGPQQMQRKVHWSILMTGVLILILLILYGWLRDLAKDESAIHARLPLVYWRLLTGDAKTDTLDRSCLQVPTPPDPAIISDQVRNGEEVARPLNDPAPSPGAQTTAGTRLQCGRCSKTFSRQDNRNKHWLGVHGEKVECGACGKRYNKYYLDKHQCKKWRPGSSSQV